MSTLDDGRAALSRGRPVIAVTPPDPAQAGVAWALLGLPATPGQITVVVTADTASAVEWTAVAPSGVHAYAVVSPSRAVRTLRDRSVNVIAGAADDLLAVAAQSALKLETVATLVLAWPEQIAAAGHGDALETLLGEARAAQRVVLSWNPAGLTAFFARHAHRAEVVGTSPGDDGRGLPPVGPAGFAITTAVHRPAAARDAVDALGLHHPFVWNGGATDLPESAPPDGVLCLRLPTRDEFAALSRLHAPVLFPTAGQLSYVRSIAAPLTPVQLSAAADRAEDRAAMLRDRIVARLAAGSADADLLLLQPLFDRFDPAEVAAALVGLVQGTGNSVSPAGADAPAAWSKVFVKVGSKDGARAKDLVAALIREVGLAKAEIGRIDIRDTFSVIEVASDAEQRAVRGLNRVAIRGRRVEAREDRVPDPAKRGRPRHP